MNTPVNFELAKLLKEEMFNEPIKQRYFIAENIDSDRSPFLQKECALYNWNNYDDFSTSYYSAPTIAEVRMWLYEKHGIWISVELCIVGSDEWEYGYKVVYLPKEFKNAKKRAIHLTTKESFQEGMSSYSGAWHTPTEAYEAAIEYCLTNLI